MLSRAERVQDNGRQSAGGSVSDGRTSRGHGQLFSISSKGTFNSLHVCITRSSNPYGFSFHARGFLHRKSNWPAVNQSQYPLICSILVKHQRPRRTLPQSPQLRRTLMLSPQIIHHQNLQADSVRANVFLTTSSPRPSVPY